MELRLKRDIAIAALIAAGCAVLAVSVNRFHPKAIPFIAEVPYETTVPCPVSEGKAAPLSAAEAISSKAKISWVDARSKTEFDAWHIPGAVRMTYDYLDPIPEKDLKNLALKIAAQRTEKVVVVGDDATPSTGELLGKEISEQGIRNVFFVRGGAQALKEAFGVKEAGR